MSRKIYGLFILPPGWGVMMKNFMTNSIPKQVRDKLWLKKIKKYTNEKAFSSSAAGPSNGAGSKCSK